MSVEELYRRSKNRFIKKILPIVKSRELAEDLLQDAMIVAMERYHLYDATRSKEETWFSYILFSTVWNWKRREKRQVLIDSQTLEDLEDILVAPPEGLMSDAIDVGKVTNPLHKLVIELHLKNGYSIKQIAWLLRGKESNFRKVLQRVQRKL